MAGTIIPILAYAKKAYAENTNSDGAKQTLLDKFFNENYPGLRTITKEGAQAFFEHLTWTIGWRPAIERIEEQSLWHSLSVNANDLFTKIMLPDGQVGFLYGSEFCCDYNEPSPGYTLNLIDKNDFLIVGFHADDSQSIELSYTTKEDIDKCYCEKTGRFVNYPVVYHQRVNSIERDFFDADSEKEKDYISNTLSHILKTHPEVERVTFRRYRWAKSF